MDAQPIEKSTWAESLAARLRLVQADAAGLTAEKRREFLSEEISRKLKELPKPSHKRHLEALLAQFPVGGQVCYSVAVPIAPAPVTVEPAPETFEQVFERFLGMVRNLPEAEKIEAAKRLAAEGIMQPARGEVTPETLEKLQKGLGLGGEQEIVAARLAEVAAVLAEAVCKVDQAALASLKQISPRSPVLRAESLRKTLAQFVVADSPAGPPATRVFEMLLGAMLAALQEGGKEYARRYLERMSPEMIWDVVKGEAKMWENKKEIAWNRFKELAEDYATPEQINKQIREAMGAFIEAKLSTGG
jgi:hypothetical protein